MFVLSLIGCSVDEVFQVTPGEDPPNRPCLEQFHQGGLGKTGQEQPWTSNSTADSGKVGRMPAGIVPVRGGAEPPHPEFHAGSEFFLHLKVVQSPNATSSEPSEGGGVSR